MNKEEVRQKMLDIVGDIYNAKFVEHGLNGYTKFDGHTLDEAKYTINRAFDDLTIDHPKVKLPREVGEELDAWKKTHMEYNVADFLWAVEENYEFEAISEWSHLDDDTDARVQEDHANRLADAYRYDWEAESEAKWYVKAPDSWKIDGGGLNWLYKRSYSGGIDMCNHAGDSDEQFASSELKHYHLDSDIFTLVPVGDEK